MKYRPPLDGDRPGRRRARFKLPPPGAPPHVTGPFWSVLFSGTWPPAADAHRDSVVVVACYRLLPNPILAGDTRPQTPLRHV
jgi:hypothetical protein